MSNESIARIASNLKETALALARHEDATEEINALLAMAECLEEIGAERNRPLTLDELIELSKNGAIDENKICTEYMEMNGKVYRRFWLTRPTDSDRASAAAKWDEVQEQ